MAAIDPKDRRIVQGNGPLVLLTEGSGVYVIRERASGRAVVGGRFSTRREGLPAMAALVRDGYMLEPEAEYWPLSDEQAPQLPIAPEPVLKARHEAREYDRRLMSPGGINEEDDLV